MVKQRLLSLLALFASFFALGVIGLGAFTRLIDAGLGCPDWPGCYGHLTVPLSDKAIELSLLYPGNVLNVYKAWAEMIHRYFAGTLGLFILSCVVLAFTKSLRNRTNIILAVCLLLLLAYQILLGQWTVTLKLLPIVVSQHLLGGFLILSVLWLFYLNNRSNINKIKRLEQFSQRGLVTGAIIALMILFLQITLGAWTSTNYASLSCPDFPFCLNSDPLQAIHFKEAFNLFLPTGINYEGGVLSELLRQSIQMTHRLGALIFITYMLMYSAVAMRKLAASPDLSKSLYLIWGLIFVQLCLGIINVVYKLPLVTAVSHNIIAVVLLLAMITFIFKLVKSPSKGIC